MVIFPAQFTQKAAKEYYLKRFEAFQGHLGGACDKLDQQGQVLLAEGSHNLPEPLDLLGSRRVACVLRVAPQIIHIDLRQPRDEQLQLMIIEHVDQILHMISA